MAVAGAHSFSSSVPLDRRVEVGSQRVDHPQPECLTLGGGRRIQPLLVQLVRHRHGDRVPPLGFDGRAQIRERDVVRGREARGPEPETRVLIVAPLRRAEPHGREPSDALAGVDDVLEAEVEDVEPAHFGVAARIRHAVEDDLLAVGGPPVGESLQSAAGVVGERNTVRSVGSHGEEVGRLELDGVRVGAEEKPLAVWRPVRIGGIDREGAIRRMLLPSAFMISIAPLFLGLPVVLVRTNAILMPSGDHCSTHDRDPT